METKEIFGLPVVVSDAVEPGTMLVGSYPKPERSNMTVAEYATQCSRYFTKIKHRDYELKPCPFCGHEQGIIDWSVQQPDGEMGAAHLMHNDDCFFAAACGAKGHAIGGSAIQAWQRRS